MVSQATKTEDTGGGTSTKDIHLRAISIHGR